VRFVELEAVELEQLARPHRLESAQTHRVGWDWFVDWFG